MNASLMNQNWYSRQQQCSGLIGGRYKWRWPAQFVMAYIAFVFGILIHSGLKSEKSDIFRDSVHSKAKINVYMKSFRAKYTFSAQYFPNFSPLCFQYSQKILEMALKALFFLFMPSSLCQLGYPYPIY